MKMLYMMLVTITGMLWGALLICPLIVGITSDERSTVESLAGLRLRERIVLIVIWVVLAAFFTTVMVVV